MTNVKIGGVGGIFAISKKMVILFAHTFLTVQMYQNARKLTLCYQYTLLDLLVCCTDTCWNAPALVTSARSLAAILGLESPSSVYPPVSAAPVSSIQRSPSHTAASRQPTAGVGQVRARISYKQHRQLGTIRLWEVFSCTCRRCIEY